MTSARVIERISAEPFQPFRIKLTSGLAFDIRHPEMIMVGRRDVLIFTFVKDSPEVYDKWQNISLEFIESLAPLELPIA